MKQQNLLQYSQPFYPSLSVSTFPSLYLSYLLQLIEMLWLTKAFIVTLFPTQSLYTIMSNLLKTIYIKIRGTNFRGNNKFQQGYFYNFLLEMYSTFPANSLRLGRIVASSPFLSMSWHPPRQDGMLRNRQRKKRGENKTNKTENYMNCRTQKL